MKKRTSDILTGSDRVGTFSLRTLSAFLSMIPKAREHMNENTQVMVATKILLTGWREYKLIDIHLNKMLWLDHPILQIFPLPYHKDFPWP